MTARDVRPRRPTASCGARGDPTGPGSGHARRHYLDGLRLLRDGEPEAAAGCLAEAILALPSHTGATINLVRAWLAAGRPDRALAAADAALTLLPDHAELHFSRGTALNALGQPAAAKAALQRAIVLDPSSAAAHLNLGNACADLDEPGAAEQAIRAALSRDPALAEAHASLGFVLTQQGRLPEAIAACEAAIALRPEFAQAHWNLAAAALLSGDYPRGFVEYEWRKRHARFGRDFPLLPGPAWTGGDPAGRILLVRAEQGLGDTIQLARYLPLIAARGGSPILACPPPLRSWLATLPGLQTTTPADPIPRYDAWVDQMSLPLMFRTRVDSIPGAAGYLAADPAREARWRARLPPSRRIGLAWAGNPAHGNDRRRSLPRSAAAALVALCGDRGVNLQIGPRAQETPLPALAGRLTDFAETAALVAALDLVITVDTAVAHVAGALGVTCWVMLPFAPDWRWMLRRDDSPWYASVRLFRQPRPGDWNGVIEQIRIALHRDAAPDRGSRDTPRTTRSAPGS